ncbi:MAG: hypothetical protein QOE70_6168 [Chthoniobacter sp.]|jgi:hypothetical protein|nr:hypothetical protein [Chthoniobacter sp.]
MSIWRKLHPGLLAAGLLSAALFHAPAAEPLVDDGPRERDPFMQNVADMLAKTDYDGLEQIAEEARASKARFTDGTWKLTYFYSAFVTPEPGSEASRFTPGSWKELFARLDDWVAARPTSGTARLARLRGSLAATTAYRSTAKLEGDANLWRKYLHQTWEQHGEARRLAAKDPYFYEASLEVASQWKLKPEEFEQRYQRAVAFEPEYAEYYCKKALWLEGNPQQQPWEDYAAEVAKATQERSGAALYAQIVWSRIRHYRLGMFTDSRASWPLAKQGFLDLEKQAPRSRRNLNAFCYFACAAGDRETAAQLFARLDNRWDKELWGTEARFEEKKKWALSPPDQDQEPGAETEITQRAHQALEAAAWGDLEALAAKLRTDKTRDAQGEWLLSNFYDALGEPRVSNPWKKDWDKFFAALEAWRMKLPESATPCIALGGAWTNYAWKARGSGYAGEVTDEGWRLMEERLDQARTALEAARNFPNKDAEWFRALQKVALGQGWPREEYEQLFAEATKFEPGFADYYTGKAYFLLPRWFGEPGEWEAFAAESADRTKDPQLYARIVSHNATKLDPDPFAPGRLSWPRLRESFAAWYAQYPDRAILLKYTWLACQARDRESARGLFAKIGEPTPVRPWHSKEDFEAWKAWAGGGPEPE